MTLPAWIKEPDLQQFFAATAAKGGEARAVGGAVRDHLLGVEGGDVDLASTLTPQQTLEMASAHGWKAIPTGIDHGTVTVVLPTRVVEVTTLRKDVTTDGRRATVAFTDNWQEDAARRDFTINALYMDARGKLYDYFDGEKDIAAHRVAFIGDAATRIAEDGLRMLRFFRFLATHGQPPADAEALTAISAQAAMVEKLSGERIANEMRKLLSAPAPAYALRMMRQSGLAARVFGGEIDPSRMIRLQLLESQADYQVSVWGRAFALLALPPALSRDLPEGGGKLTHATQPTSPFGGEVDRRSGGGVDWIVLRWKLARHEAQQLRWLATQPAFDAAAPKHVHTRMLRLDGAPAYFDWLLTQAALTPGMDVAPYVALARDFKPPIFPITAKDLLARGMKEGKALGDKLSLLEAKWEESGYVLTKDELLSL